MRRVKPVWAVLGLVVLVILGFVTALVGVSQWDALVMACVAAAFVTAGALFTGTK